MIGKENDCESDNKTKYINKSLILIEIISYRALSKYFYKVYLC